MIVDSARRPPLQGTEGQRRANIILKLFLKLFSTKLLYYLLAIRPYYSFLHNAYLLGFLLPLYYLFVVGLKKSPLDIKAYLFIGCFLLVHTLSATLLTINWNSRFLLPFLPMMFLVGSGGLYGMIKEKNLIRDIIFKNYFFSKGLKPSN
ncbi:MAG: hypothetical protein WD431_16240 [Cyclobacteriaceae bacterium]